MHSERRPPGPDTIALFAVVVAALTLFSIAFGPLAVGRPVPTLLTDRSNGGQELSWAKASLEQGSGPATLLSPHGIASLLAPPSVVISAGSYTWDNLTTGVGAAPPAGLPVMTWDPATGYVLLYIGLTVRGDFADTWTYENGTWTNITASTTGAPPVLLVPSIAYDPSTSQVILFGGETPTNQPRNYTWAYHAGTWINLTSTAGAAPSPRLVAAMTTDSTDGEVVLVGGQNASGDFQRDTWTFKDGTWANVTSAQSFALRPMVYPTLTDYPGHGAFLVGEMIYNLTNLVPGTFEFSAGMWTNLTSTVGPEPQGVALGSGFYVPSMAAVFTFGFIVVTPNGGSFVYPTTWEFIGGAWQNITSITGTTADQFGEFAGSAFDPIDQSILTYSGINVITSRISSATWVLSAPPIVSAAASKAVVDVGTNVDFTGTVSSGLDPNSVSWSFGDGSSATSVAASHAYTHPGVYTANLTATDFRGTTGTATVTVFVNAAPTVSIALAPTPPVAGSAVGFLPSLSGGTAPFTYAWSFGDGSTSTSAAPSYTYAGSGSFTVKLTVTDAVGASASSNLTVAVASAPASSTAISLTSGTGLYLLLGIVLLLIVVILLAVLLARKPREPRGPAATYTGSPSGGSQPAIPPGAT
ncbi:MAG: PKD domain-containing protein [Thermoplasmata archaeon]